MISKELIQDNFPTGEVTLVAARPAMGKSSLAISIALSLAQMGEKCLYFSVEMDEKALIDKMIMQVGEERYSHLIHCIKIDDTPSLRTSVLQQRFEENPVKYIFVDNLQLMSVDTPLSSRKEELNFIVQFLKGFAKKNQAVVIATSQLLRGIGNEKDPRPFLSDIRDISAESLKDMNIKLLYRGSYYHRSYSDQRTCNLEGETEFISYNEGEYISSLLYFNEDTTEFSSWPTWSCFKKELLNTRNWIVHLNAEDIEKFEKGNIKDAIVMEAYTEDTSEERLKSITKNIQKQLDSTPVSSDITKLILFIQFPLSVPLKLSEMVHLNDLAQLITPEGKDCEMRWGLSARNDKLCSIICAYSN